MRYVHLIKAHLLVLTQSSNWYIAVLFTESPGHSSSSKPQDVQIIMVVYLYYNIYYNIVLFCFYACSYLDYYHK
jgi:hypothetical protein